MNNTRDLAQFGQIELDEVANLLTAMRKHGLPDGFYDSGVCPEFNPNSGYVFLVNEDFQVCMYDDETGTLYMFHSCPECGEEGCQEDLISWGNDCCKKYLIACGAVEEDEDEDE